MENARAGLEEAKEFEQNVHRNPEDPNNQPEDGYANAVTVHWCPVTLTHIHGVYYYKKSCLLNPGIL